MSDVPHLVSVPLTPPDRQVLKNLCEFLKVTPEHAVILSIHAMAGGILGHTKKAQQRGEKVRAALRKQDAKARPKGAGAGGEMKARTQGSAAKLSIATGPARG